MHVILEIFECLLLDYILGLIGFYPPVL